MFSSDIFKHISCPLNNISQTECVHGDFCCMNHHFKRSKPNFIPTKRLNNNKKQSEPTLVVDNQIKINNQTKVQPNITVSKRPLPISPNDIEPCKNIKRSTSTSNTITLDNNSYTSSNSTPLNNNTSPTSTSPNNNPPLIKPNLNCKISREKRQNAINKFFIQFTRIYQNIINIFPSLPHDHAIQQEENLLNASKSIQVYSTSSVSILSKLKNRNLAVDINDIGIQGLYSIRKPLVDDIHILDQFLVTKDDLLNNGYPFETHFNDPSCLNPKSTESNASPIVFYPFSSKTCDRCKTLFTLSENKETCLFHKGRRDYSQRNSLVYSCCLDSIPCQKSKHVFKETDLMILNEFSPFSRVNEINEKKTQKELLSIDCEMVYTHQGMELGRICVIDSFGIVLIDEYIKTQSPVICYNTSYSGITTLENATHSLSTIRDLLFQFMDRNTILIGHGLENDLLSLRIIHEKIIDTSLLFPHSVEGKKYGLRQLAKMYLGTFIQGSLNGHSPLEDAKACIDLVKYKISKI